MSIYVDIERHQTCFRMEHSPSAQPTSSSRQLIMSTAELIPQRRVTTRNSVIRNINRLARAMKLRRAKFERNDTRTTGSQVHFIYKITPHSSAMKKEKTQTSESYVYFEYYNILASH
jgi:hypothetical protein